MATRKVPAAVPKMITNSHGCMSTARCPPMAANPPSSAAIVMTMPTKLPNAPLHHRPHRRNLFDDACVKLASPSPAPRKLFPAVRDDIATAVEGSCHAIHDRGLPENIEGHEPVAFDHREETGCQPRNRILPHQYRQGHEHRRLPEGLSPVLVRDESLRAERH